MRLLAQTALRSYGLEDMQLEILNHWENTTFRVGLSNPRQYDLPPPYINDRLLLRIHRAGYQSPEAVSSELQWLEALSRETNINVPIPVRAQNGAFTVQAATEGIPDGRTCSVLHWMRGQFDIPELGREHFHLAGELLGNLHNHADHWDLPPHFIRHCGRWENLFGTKTNYALAIDRIWPDLTSQARDVFQQVSQRAKEVMADLGDETPTFGLIHSDLGFGSNILFDQGSIYPIDFDDCKFGYRLYDLAVVVDKHPDQELHEALFSGYTRQRALPTKVREYLGIFIAIRRVAIALWATGQAVNNPAFVQQKGRLQDIAIETANRYLN